MANVFWFDAARGPHRFDVKHLRSFLAVADAGSFSRAAKRLDTSQSHLSRQIMRLEAALGHSLFVRNRRPLELTDAGELLREEADFVTSRLDGLPQRMREQCSLDEAAAATSEPGR